jgi:hypothetical protein
VSIVALTRRQLGQRDRGTGLVASATLLLWLCTLPIIGLVLVPLIGPAWTGMAAVGVLCVVAPLCWFAFRLPQGASGVASRQRRLRTARR